MAYIFANFCFVIQTVKHFETKNMFLAENLSIIEKSVDKLENIRRKHCLTKIC